MKAKKLWLHLGFYNIIQTIFRFSDKFLLTLFLASGIYAVYFNGVQAAEVPFLPYLLGAVAGSILIEIAHTSPGSLQSIRLMHDSSKLLVHIIFPLFFFLLLFREELFEVVFTKKYLPSVPIFTVAIFLLPLRVYSYTTLLQHNHLGGIINKGALLDLTLAIALMYPLYVVFGLPGIAASPVISTYIQSAYYIFHLKKATNTSLRTLLPLSYWLLHVCVYGFGFTIAFQLSEWLGLSLWPKFSLAVVCLVLFSLVGFLKTFRKMRGNRPHMA